MFVDVTMNIADTMFDNRRHSHQENTEFINTTYL